MGGSSGGGSIPFILLSPDAVAPIELNGEVTILSAEDGTVSYMQHYSFHTGIAFAIPEGKIGFLAETQPMGSRGISVVGKFVTHNDMGEVRVGMHNLSRTAFPVQKGMPIARLVLLDAGDLTLEEVKGDDKKSALDHWQEEIQKRKDEETDEEKKAAELHGGAVSNGPGKNPITDSTKKLPENSGTKGSDAKKGAPDGKDVSDANASRNAGNPGAVVPGVNQAGGNAVKTPKETGTPATV